MKNRKKTARKRSLRRFGRKLLRFFKKLLVVIVKLAILAAIVYAGTQLITVTDGHFHLVTASSLDLRGTGIKTNAQLERYIRLQAVDMRGNGLSLEEYSDLKAERPGMYIRWDIPIDGQRLDCKTENFVFDTLPEDYENLLLFDKVSSIKIEHPEDRDGIIAFAKTYPAGVVDWNVRWGDEWLPLSTGELTVEGSSPLLSELLDIHGYLPNLKVIKVSGDSLSPTRQNELVDAYPELSFVWDIKLGSDVFKTDAETLAFTEGTGPKMSELEAALRFLPNLKTIDFEGSNVSPADRCSFRAAHPEYECTWSVNLLGSVYPNTQTKLHFDSLKFEKIAEIQTALELLPDMQTVEVNHLSFSAGSGASLEELEAAADLLTNLKSFDFEGSAVEAKDRCSFRAAHPDVECTWSVSFLGEVYDNTVTELHLDGMQFENTDELHAALALWPDMQRVEIDNTNLSDDDIGALADEFTDTHFIWTIHFSNYFLRTDATFFIPSAWKGGWTLYNRDVKPLRYCRDMIGLDLGHTCVETLDFVQYMPHLKYLIIVDSSVYDISPLSYCKELEYLEAYVLGIRDFSPLLDCPNLKHLNIGYTRSPANAAFEVLSRMTQLERLWYCCCPFSYEQVQAMHEALPNCEMYMPSLGQSTGSTWRYHQSYYDMRDLFGMYYMPGGTAGTDADGNQVIIDDWGTRIVLYDWDLTQRWFEMDKYKNLNWHIVGINC